MGKEEIVRNIGQNLGEEVLFEAIRDEDPDFYWNFVNMLVDRWMFKTKKAAKLCANIIPSNPKSFFTPYVRRCFKLSTSKKQTSVLKMHTHLSKLTNKTISLHSKYISLCESHKASKSRFLHSILVLIRYMTLFGKQIEFDAVFEKEDDQVTIEEVERKLVELHTSISKWKE